jgi:two-component system OmpR family response regulator
MMGGAKILVVDDDPGIRDLVSMALVDAGFEVATAANGRLGWEAFQTSTPDLVVLDLLMPELDGLELCRQIRKMRATPIVMLTSRDEEMDVLLGLETGADDYITKPFSVRELIARIRAALRRVVLDKGGDTTSCLVGHLLVDRGRREVRIKDIRVEVTATEFELLWTFVRHPNRAFSRDELIDRVYGNEVHVTDRTIDTFVKRTRAKLRAIDPEFDEIETVRSVGYRYRG